MTELIEAQRERGELEVFGAQDARGAVYEPS